MKSYLFLLIPILQLTGALYANIVKPNLNNVLFNGDFEFVDLSHAFNKDAVYWPNTRNFSLVSSYAGLRKDGTWYAANEFSAGEHGGTHLDAPYHFDKQGSFVEDIPLQNLILPLIIADVSDKVLDNPDFVLTTDHLDHMINNYFGRIEQPCLVIFKFGWSKYYRSREKYLGITENGTLNFPGLSGEVADWIVRSYKNIVGVGVDTASVDPGSSTSFQTHKTLLGAGLYQLENVRLDQHIPDAVCTALVMPMKIERGTGAPLRLVAICPKDRMAPPATSLHRI